MKLTIQCLAIVTLALTTSRYQAEAIFSTNNQSDTITKQKTMENQSFTTSFQVNQSPTEVFNAVNNPRAWWSEQIEGITDQLNAVFNYHYRDVHRCQLKLIELIPNKKVVWLVLDNHFDFTKDKTEWKNTKISFEIERKGEKTELVFTHIGLVPAYECYDICHDAWTNYINGSLRSLIETGKGKPNPYEAAVKSAGVLKETNEKGTDAGKMKNQDYSVGFDVDKSAQEVFDDINNIAGWWTENVTGKSHQLNDEFEVRFADVHYSKQKLVEVIPSKKVVWLITDSHLSFLQDKNEWNGTEVIFEINERDGKTHVQFTHKGLVPSIECYGACSNAWTDYIQNSLRGHVTNGKGKPDKKK